MIKKIKLTEGSAPYYTLVEDVTPLDEAGKPKLPDGVIQQVRFRAGKAGHITANGRLYSKKLMKREVERIQPRIKRRAVKILSGHPKKGESPDPEREIGVLTGLSMVESNGPDDGDILATMDVIPTSAGNNFVAKTRARTEVGFSSRGPGTATVVKFTDQHEDFSEDNAEWVGKEIEMVNPDYELNTYDHVIGQAVEDAVGLNYNEHKETEEMEFDITKLTEADWKSILESDQVKQRVEAAVKDATDKLEAGFKDQLPGMVEKYIKDNFDVVEARADDAEDKTEAKCAECGSALGKGAKFCPACGLKVAKAEEKKPETEADKKVEALLKAVEDLKAKNEEQAQTIADMKQKDKEREEAKQVEKVIAEALKGKPATVANEVRDRLADKKLTPEDVKEIVEATIGKVENFVESVGGTNLGEPAGEGAAVHGDKDQRTEVTEETQVAKVESENLDEMLED